VQGDSKIRDLYQAIGIQPRLHDFCGDREVQEVLHRFFRQKYALILFQIQQAI